MEWRNEPSSAWRSSLRIAVEFLVLFAGALFVEHFLPEGIRGSYPNPLWIPVVLLSLQHGTLSGLAAAIVASGILFSQSLPTAILSEDFYDYMSRVGAEPISWITVALLIGHVRDRQIREKSELLAELAERDIHCQAVAYLCDDLRNRAATLERHIAANGTESHADIAEAISGLYDSNPTNFAERLGRFIPLMTGTSEYAVYLLQDDALRIALHQEHANAFDPIIKAGEPLFEAVVNGQKILLSARAIDRDLLKHRDSIIGPLVDRSAPYRVIGILWVEGSRLVEPPPDIERVFALTCSEISRSLLRNMPVGSASVRLIEGTKQAASVRSSQPLSKADRRELRVG